MKNRLELTITISPKLLKYLQDVADLEGFGLTEGEVAKRFVWDGVNSLIESRRLKERA